MEKKLQNTIGCTYKKFEVGIQLLTYINILLILLLSPQSFRFFNLFGVAMAPDSLTEPKN